MPMLRCEISQSLFDALTEKQRETGEPIASIVTDALADALQVDHATLFQVSAAGALVAGVTRGTITVGELAGHGDFGLGTFDDFDGEMVVVDGTIYQMTKDGVSIAPDDGRVPFAVITHFVPETDTGLAEISAFDDLTDQLDALRTTDNEFFAVRLDGRFDHVKTRVVCRSDGPTTLVDAAAHQAESELEDVDGVVVGFWSPEYTSAVTVPGWHLHFLTGDRLAGGHLLTCLGTDVRVRTQHLSDFRVALPETETFLRADLGQDPSEALRRAERDG